MDNNIQLYTATKGKKEECALYKSNISKNLKIIYKEDNTASLHACYNDFLNNARQNNVDIAVLVHDDVYINTDDIDIRLKKYANKFTVFGLAGATTCTINDPALWHLMSKKETQRGCVAHGDTNQYIYTSFGLVDCRALVIDGVFIGINISKLPVNVKFNEDYPSRFHFYDLSFSLECAINRIPVGIADIPIIHQSPGLTRPDKEFYDGQAYFLQQYAKYKGKTISV